VFRLRCYKENPDRGIVYSQYSDWRRPVETDEMNPILLNIYNSSAGADLRWIQDSSNGSYIIMRKQDGIWQDIAEISAEEAAYQNGACRFIDEEIAAEYGKGFIYSVAVRNDEDVLCYDSLGLPLYRLNAPEVLSATVTYSAEGDTQLLISWTATEAHSYEVQCSSDKGSTWKKIGRTESAYLLIDGFEPEENTVIRVRCEKTNQDRGTVWSQYSSWKKLIIIDEDHE
jgi:hypothetical protein